MSYLDLARQDNDKYNDAYWDGYGASDQRTPEEINALFERRHLPSPLTMTKWLVRALWATVLFACLCVAYFVMMWLMLGGPA